MKVIQLSVIGLLLSAAAGTSAAQGPDDGCVFDIPRMGKISVDGNRSDWGDGGFKVKAMTYRVLKGRTPPSADDCDASFRLGWNEDGLLIWVSVRDETIQEYPRVERLWEMDSVGVHLAESRGSKNLYQLQIAPGMDGEHTELRSFFYDRRSNSPENSKKLSAKIAAARIDGGYAIEGILPWENLGKVPAGGQEIAVQIICFDYDGRERSYSEAMWFPRGGAHEDSNLMHRVRLSAEASEPVLALANGRYEKLLHPAIHVYGSLELVGDPVIVREGEKLLADAALVKRNGRAAAIIPLAMPPVGKTWDKLSISVAGRGLGTIRIPDPGAHRAGAFMQSKIRFQSICFTGRKFPGCDFEDPRVVKDLIGPYTISMQYFDRDFNEVAAPGQPGRYGAVVAIKFGNRLSRRFQTLYCVSTEDRPLGEFAGKIKVHPDIDLPPQLGIDPKDAQSNSQALEDYLRDCLRDGHVDNPDCPVVLAGLNEAIPGEKMNVFNDMFARDRQWWVTMKRKFYGLEKRYAKPLICPRPIEGTPRPTIREGTLAEAGMNPDAIDKIDAILRKWATDSDEAFAVCIVRHGVVVLHKAYGMRNGKPMTVTTPSNMASITKLLGGTMIMMAVDQGMLDLEAPLDKIHPAFAGIEVATPLTIRLLCNHWSGLSGHWREMQHDLEEVIASGYASLEVNKRYEYNSVDIELAGKFLELAAAEALPQLYKRHLIDPLDLKHTKTTRMGFGTRSIPMDMAKIAQMLLNRGAYGNKLFFSRETFEKMLPEKTRRGIGTARLGGSGLSEKAFGHPAASNATIRIDLQNDLVIVMCRNTAGKHFSKYHDRFIQTVADGMQEE